MPFLTKRIALVVITLVFPAPGHALTKHGP